jgi:hypothetical protein
MSTPQGYTVAASAGGADTPIELTCDECGASVRPQAADRHTNWHGTLVTEQRAGEIADGLLTEAFTLLNNRSRYSR